MYSYRKMTEEQQKQGDKLITVIFMVCLYFNLTIPADASPAKVIKKSNNGPSQIYLANLRSRLLSHWYAPDGHNRVVLELRVNPEGDILESKTNESKASDLAITAALTALDQSKPLGHLPANYSVEGKITIVFSSNVDPHGDSTSDLTTAIDQINNNPSQAERPPKSQ